MSPQSKAPRAQRDFYLFNEWKKLGPDEDGILYLINDYEWRSDVQEPVEGICEHHCTTLLTSRTCEKCGQSMKEASL